MTNELWDAWSEFHSDPEQKKRCERAKEGSLTPTFVDQCACTAKFKGSSGNHTTSLNHCTCIDFNRRRLPCKHMYRLAMEVGLIDCDFKSDKNAPIYHGDKLPLEISVKVIESLPPEEQKILHEIYSNFSTTRPSYCIKTTPELEKLRDLDFFSIEQDFNSVLNKYKMPELRSLCSNLGITPPDKLKKADLINFIVSTVSDKLADTTLLYTVVKRNPKLKFTKIAAYLHRKFDTTSIYKEDVGYVDVPLLHTELPYDDVTALLMKYKHYE